MSDRVPVRMTSDEFIAWAMEQPEGQHYELTAGEVIARGRERIDHARTKMRVWRCLADAVEAAGLNWEVYPNGMAVEIDAGTVCEPDAPVRTGSRLPDDAVKLSDPVIVVEVVSPWTRARDTGAKLVDYFRLPSVVHYLIVRTEDGALVHHARNGDGSILTRIVREGPVWLDPPGLALADLFPKSR